MFSMMFCGNVEHVNYDRNGAHIRLDLFEKRDLLNGVKVEVEHKACISLRHWSGYDYDDELASQVRSLVKGDVIAVCIDRYKGFLGRVDEKISIRNHTLEDYEPLDETEDLLAWKKSGIGEMSEHRCGRKNSESAR